MLLTVKTRSILRRLFMILFRWSALIIGISMGVFRHGAYRSKLQSTLALLLLFSATTSLVSSFIFLVAIEKLSQILITYSLGLVVCNLVLVFVSIRILSQKLRGRLLLRLGILLEFALLAHYMFLVDLIRLDKAQELLGSSAIFFGINFFLLNFLMLINTRYSH